MSKRRWCGWWKRNRRSDEAGRVEAASMLREFVYVDEVSVNSLLASRTGAIATEFTDVAETSVSSSIESSVGANAGVAKSDLRVQSDERASSSAQVLRKTIVQSAFKELHDLQEDALAISMKTPGEVPPIDPNSDIENQLLSAIKSGWGVPCQALTRGALIEVEVQLEADPIFRVNTIVSTIRKIMVENLQLFGAANVAQLADMRSMGRMLESLLGDLIPVRARLTSYEVVLLKGEDYLVHSALLDAAQPHGIKGRPLSLVGSAERKLFWKDIRRVLFSGARYTVFGRLADAGVTSEWRPIKMLDILSEVHPQLGGQFDDFGEMALGAMSDAASRTTTKEEGRLHTQRILVQQYVSLVADHHGRSVTQADLDHILRWLPPAGDWHLSVDGRRPILRDANRRLDDLLGVDTPADVACDLRMAALVHSGFGLASASRQGGFDSSGSPNESELFLEAEITAIYW